MALTETSEARDDEQLGLLRFLADRDLESGAEGLLRPLLGIDARDPEVWRDPDAFVARRFAEPDAPRLFSFGGGPHYCLGAALARMTLEGSVRGVAELAPTLTVDPESIEWCQVLGHSPATLPVTI